MLREVKNAGPAQPFSPQRAPYITEGTQSSCSPLPWRPARPDINLKTRVAVSLDASLGWFFLDMGLWVAASHPRCVCGDLGLGRPGSRGLPCTGSIRGDPEGLWGEYVCCQLELCISPEELSDAKRSGLDVGGQGFPLAALQVVATMAGGAEPRPGHERWARQGGRSPGLVPPAWAGTLCRA